MFPSDLLGILSGLTSAIVWGSGDFVGGLAARKIPQFQVVALAALVGAAIFVPFAILLKEPVPSTASLAWSAAAGISGAIGVAAFYRALSTGASAVVAPTAAVVGAAIPVLVAGILEGWPGPLEAAGIAVGLAGIWLVSRAPTPEKRQGKMEFGLAVLAGVGFAGFFIFIAQVEQEILFAPLIVAKLAALGFAWLVLVARRQSLPALAQNPLALLAGSLDAGGNLFFFLAQRYTTLAVAAVLSSMYPAATIFLSRMILHERIVRRQVWGVVLCLAAVIMIAI